MDPYLNVLVGDKKATSKVCQDGGKNPQWIDAISLQRNFEPVCHIEIMDKDKFSQDDIVGVGQLDLNSIPPNKVSAKWYSLYFHQNPAGEVLIEVIFTPDNQKSHFGGHHIPQPKFHPHWGGHFGKK